LKVIDDKYCDAEAAVEKEIEILRKQFAARQAPLLEERTKVLSDEAEAKDEDKTKGTPACPEFWAKAMSNAGQMSEIMFDCDEQVFEYIKDIKASLIDADCEKKGYRVEFTFAENPFFTNTSLWLEAHYDYDAATARPWKEPDCIELKACAIDWKAGKNITVAKKEAPVKKGKKKTGKAKESPCASFFRAMFSSCKKSDEAPPEVAIVYEEMARMGGEQFEDEDELLEMHLESVGQVCNFIYSELVPYAVRFYTGEACEDDDDDEEGEEESSVEDSEEESDEEPPPQKKGGKKEPKAAPAKKGAAAGEDADGKKTEECKQQ